MSLTRWLGGAWTIIILRMTFESFSGNGLDIYPMRAIFLHPPLFYFALMMTMVIFLYWLTKVRITKIFKMLLIGFGVILVPPFVDFFASGGKGDVLIQYLFNPFPELVHKYFTFFGSNFEAGATYGIRTQVIIVMTLVAIYVFTKTRKPWKTVVAVFGSYTIFFLYGAIPAIVGSLAYLPRNPWGIASFEILSKFIESREIFEIFYGPERVLELFSIEMSIILLPLVFFQLYIVFFLWNKKKCLAFLASYRYLRLALHFVALAIGVFLGMQIFNVPFDFSLYGILTFLALIIATVALWTFSLTINDRNDLEIDKISNPNRLLPTDRFTREEFREIGLIAFILAVLAGFSVGYTFAVMIVAALLLSILYSAYPFRLRRFPLVAPGLMSLGMALLIFVGFLLFAESGTFYDFPINLFALTIFVVALIINIKDIKDLEGDKKNGVRTIPTIFGLKRGKLIVSLLFVLSFMLFPIILLVKELILTAVIFSVLTFLVINSKKVREWAVFGIYSVYLIVVGFILF